MTTIMKDIKMITGVSNKLAGPFLQGFSSAKEIRLWKTSGGAGRSSTHTAEVTLLRIIMIFPKRAVRAGVLSSCANPMNLGPLISIRNLSIVYPNFWSGIEHDQ